MPSPFQPTFSGVTIFWIRISATSFLWLQLTTHWPSISDMRNFSAKYKFTFDSASKGYIFSTSSWRRSAVGNLDIASKSLLKALRFSSGSVVSLAVLLRFSSGSVVSLAVFWTWFLRYSMASANRKVLEITLSPKTPGKRIGVWLNDKPKVDWCCLLWGRENFFQYFLTGLWTCWVKQPLFQPCSQGPLFSYTERTLGTWLRRTFWNVQDLYCSAS